MPLARSPVTGPSAFYFHQRLHEFLVVIDAFLLDLLLVILFEDAKIVVLLPVDDGGLGVE